MALQLPLAAAKYQQCITAIDETISILLMLSQHRKRKAEQVNLQAAEIAVAPVSSPEAPPAPPLVKAVSKPSSRPTAVKSSAVKSLQASGKAIPKPLQAKVAQAKPTATKSAPQEPPAKRPRIELEDDEIVEVSATPPVKAAPAKTPAVAAAVGENDVSKLKARLAALKEKAAQLEAVEAKRAAVQKAAAAQKATASPPVKAAPVNAPPEKAVTRPRPPVPVFEVAEIPVAIETPSVDTAAETTAVVEPVAPVAPVAPVLLPVIEEPESDDDDMMDDDLMAGLMNRLGGTAEETEDPVAEVDAVEEDTQASVADSQVTNTPSEADALRAALEADDLEEEEEEEEEGGLEEQVIPPGVVQTVVAGDVAGDVASEGEEGEESEEEYDPFSTDATEPTAA